MAAPIDRSFEEVLTGIEKREQTARRRVVVYTALPVLAAALLVWYASEQIKTLTASATELRKQITTYESQIESLKEELSAAEERLQSATELNQYLHPIDLPDIKAAFSRYPAQAKVLSQIFDLRRQGVSWHLGGQSPHSGFDSPSFAAYILRELNLPGAEVQPGESLLQTSRRLFERLPPISEPRVGDLAFYPTGYVLFHFEDRRRRPFVIGMTPFGITALEPEFANVIGYRRIKH
jgi:hypothetical protein